jgi:hypothetical protein
MKTYYPSERSGSIGIPLWGIILSSFGFALYMVYKHASVRDLIILVSIETVVILFVGMVWFRTGYFLSKDYLIVKIGPVTHSRISISDITKISRSNSILSSPANSLKRLAIRSGQRVLAQISPKDEISFIKTIVEINPGITIDLIMK